MGESGTFLPPEPDDRGSATAGRTLTVADVLALPVLATGQPQVVTGVTRLDRPVRWVHITELTDPASFLKGGELVLTTGMPLPEDPTGVRRYVDELTDVGAAALVIELVRRYHRPPDALVQACRARDLPLVTLAKDVNFLEVTQVVHTLLLGHQTDAMLRTQRIHEAFTGLTLRGAGPQDVVRAAAEMSGRTVVLENLVHQALICEASGSTVEEALADWEQRSRAVPSRDRTEVCGPEGWLVAPVEYQGDRWGRVTMLPDTSGGRAAFAPEDVTVLERTAMALTIARLIHTTTWERAAHRNALRDLAEQRHHSPRTPAPASPRWVCPPRADSSRCWWTCGGATTAPSRSPFCPRNYGPRAYPHSSAPWPQGGSACCWRCVSHSPGGPRSSRSAGPHAA